ncbi:hypothetical protein PQX77_018211 [Marasmius sp. AFHP31]|nr:hypothetical protein PQX77_018211 [Marasmius sp. AFHP31]
MHQYVQPTLVDQHDDSVRVQDWVAQHWLLPEISTKIIENRQPQQISPINPSFEDFTSSSSSAASSTPALGTVSGDDERHLRDETDVESDLDFVYHALPPITFKQGRHIDDSSESEASEEQHLVVMKTDKPLPLPPPASPLANHSPSPSVSVSVPETSRSRKPSIVSLSGYHLPSSVQISTSPASSQPSPRSSYASLSRQSSFSSHISLNRLAGGHGRHHSLNHQPSLPLLSPSASSTLIEEDDNLVFKTSKSSRRGSALGERHGHPGGPDTVDLTEAIPARSGKAVGQLPPDLYIERSLSRNSPELSRSGSGSSRSSSLRRKSSISSKGSHSSGSRSRGIPRHASAGNLLNGYSRPPALHSPSHSHSPSLPTPVSIHSHRSGPSNRSSAYSPRAASSHLDDVWTTADLTSSVQSSPQSATQSTGITLLAPPPTAALTSTPVSAIEQPPVVTPRNRDAVYIDAVDSEEVQRRLAALVLASGAVDTPDGADISPELNGEGQDIEYCQNDIPRSRQEPLFQSGLTSPVLDSDVSHAPQGKEQSHWSPSSSNEHLPLSALSSDLAFGSALGFLVPPSKPFRNKAKKSADDASSKKRKSLLGGKGKRETVSDGSEGAVQDASVTKHQRPRLASIISRAIGSSNGSDGAKQTSGSVLSPSTTSAATGSSPSPLPDSMVVINIAPQETIPPPRLRTASMTSVHPTVPSMSTTPTPAPTSTSSAESLPSPVSPAGQTRARSASNATRPSPLRIEVLPYAPQTSAPTTGSTPTPTAAPSTSDPLPPSLARGRSISITAGPTPPLTPIITSGRMRSESQASSTSNVSRSSKSTVLTTSTTSTSRSSVSLSLLCDQFPSPGETGDDSELASVDEEKHNASYISDDDEKSGGSDLDDGAYYVKAFERSYKSKLREAKSIEFESQQDGDITETEEVPERKKASRKSISSKRSSKRSSRPPSTSKITLPFPLPISPPPSISPSPVLPILTPPPMDDLLDDDPFAAASPTILSPATSTAPSPVQVTMGIPPIPEHSATHPYPSRSLQASRSMNALSQMGMGSTPKASTSALNDYSKARSLMSPGDLPPSRAWAMQDGVTSPAPSSSSSGKTITPSKSMPTTPTRGGGGRSYNPVPTSPGRKTPTKSKLRMSMSGLVSRLHLGSSSSRSRESAHYGVPLPPPTPGEEIIPEVPLLPTPISPPTEVFPDPSREAHSRTSQRVPCEDEDAEDIDDGVYEPMSPIGVSVPHVEYSAKRKSLGLGGGESTASRLSLSYIRAKKHRLVVGGVPVNDRKALEAVCEWCKSFGEIRQCTRKSNGDLQVDFKRGNIVDAMGRAYTCHIEGAGDVSVTWYTGKDKSTKQES